MFYFSVFISPKFAIIYSVSISTQKFCVFCEHISSDELLHMVDKFLCRAHWFLLVNIHFTNLVDAEMCFITTDAGLEHCRCI